jgi:hypothetical protein
MWSNKQNAISYGDVTLVLQGVQRQRFLQELRALAELALTPCN